MSKQRRIERIKQQVRGDEKRPRLSVTISNKHVHAQVIDDNLGKTLAYSTSHASNQDGTLTLKAQWVGEDIAKRAKKAKIKQVKLDRRGKLYHGRVAAFAESARKHGLEF